MKTAFIAMFFVLLSFTLFAAGTEDEPEEQTMILIFKDINVFEFDLDLVFMDDDSNVVWIGYINADLSELDLYTVEDNEGFPVYTVNDEKVEKKYRITYINTEVEGEFSGEMEEAMVVTEIEEVTQD